MRLLLLGALVTLTVAVRTAHRNRHAREAAQADDGLCSIIKKEDFIRLGDHGSRSGLPRENTGHGGDRWVEGLVAVRVQGGNASEWALLESVGMWKVSAVVCHSLQLRDGAPPVFWPRQWRVPVPNVESAFAEGITVLTDASGELQEALQLTYRDGVLHRWAASSRSPSDSRGFEDEEEEEGDEADKGKGAAGACGKLLLSVRSSDTPAPFLMRDEPTGAAQQDGSAPKEPTAAIKRVFAPVLLSGEANHNDDEEAGRFGFRGMGGRAPWAVSDASSLAQAEESTRQLFQGFGALSSTDPSSSSGSGVVEPVVKVWEGEAPVPGGGLARWRAGLAAAAGQSKDGSTSFFASESTIVQDLEQQQNEADEEEGGGGVLLQTRSLRATRQEPQDSTGAAAFGPREGWGATVLPGSALSTPRTQADASENSTAFSLALPWPGTVFLSTDGSPRLFLRDAQTSKPLTQLPLGGVEAAVRPLRVTPAAQQAALDCGCVLDASTMPWSGESPPQQTASSSSSSSDHADVAGDGQRYAYPTGGDGWLRPNELEAVRVRDAYGVQSLSMRLSDTSSSPPREQQGDGGSDGQGVLDPVTEQLRRREARSPLEEEAEVQWEWEVWAALYGTPRACVVRIAVLPSMQEWPVVGIVGFEEGSGAAVDKASVASRSGSDLNALAFVPAKGEEGSGSAPWAVVTGKMWGSMYAMPPRSMLPPSQQQSPSN